jgi:hypothetical protein
MLKEEVFMNYRYLLVAIFATALFNHHSHAMEATEPRMDVVEYKRENFYGIVYRHFIDELQMPSDIVANIFALMNPQVPRLFLSSLENLKKYVFCGPNVFYENDKCIHSYCSNNSCFIDLIFYLLDVCDRDVSNEILTRCLQDLSVSVSHINVHGNPEVYKTRQPRQKNIDCAHILGRQSCNFMGESGATISICVDLKKKDQDDTPLTLLISREDYAMACGHDYWDEIEKWKKSRSLIKRCRKKIIGICASRGKPRGL